MGFTARSQAALYKRTLTLTLDIVHNTGQNSQTTHLMTLSVWLCSSGLVLMDWLADARSCRVFCKSMEPF